MPAVLLVARAELRRRWLSLLVIGLIAGLTGGAAAGAAGLARRTSTADERLSAATNADDVRYIVIGGDRRATSAIGQETLSLPGVREGRIALGGVARVTGDRIFYLSVMTGPDDWGADILSPVLSGGRLPDPDRPDEVVLNELVVGRQGTDLGIGSDLELRFLTGAEFTAFDADVPLEGLAGTQRVTVVGTVRYPGEGDDLPSLVASPALAAALPEAIGVLGAGLVQIEPGADPADVQRAINKAGATVERIPELDAFPAATSAGSNAQLRASTATTTEVITAGLLILAGVAAVLGALATGQAAVRHHTSTSQEQQVQTAIGMGTGQRVAARLLAATPAIAVGVLLVAVIGGAAAGLSPPGALRLVEPHPGWSPNLALLAAVAATVVVAMAALLAAATVWSGRAGRSRPPREAPLVAQVASLGGRPPTVVGLRFAFERPGGAATSPRTAIVAVIATVAGVVACLTYSASLHRVVTTPVRHGWPTDLVLVDGSLALGRELARDERFTVVAPGVSADVRIDGHASTALSQEPIKGTIEWELVDGRPPTTREEIVFGTRTAEELGKGVGDVVTATGRDGDEHSLVVVGVGVLPAFNGDSLGRGAALTAEGLDDVASSEPFGELGLSTADGVDPQVVAEELSADYEITVAELPRDVANLAEIDRVPVLLGLFLALLGAATVGHTIVVTTGRRQRDIATLRAVGFTPRDSSRTVLVMAATIVGIGAVAALPLGVALGRAVWRLVAEGAALIGDALVPWAWVALAVPVALLAALGLAAGPARRMGDDRPATLARPDE